jgi:hypothetical protein
LDRHSELLFPQKFEDKIPTIGSDPPPSESALEQSLLLDSKHCFDLRSYSCYFFLLLIFYTAQRAMKVAVFVGSSFDWLQSFFSIIG